MVEEAIQAQVRDLRSREQYLRYDSVVIGPGAREVDPSWFNTWAQLADADRILFGGGKRSANVGLAYTNQSSEREDYAQDIYQSGIEFHAPTGIMEYEQDSTDALIFPILFTRDLPNRISVKCVIADTDTIITAPAIHWPAAVGASGQSTDDSSSNVTLPGQTGNVDVRSTWNWPEPVKIPAKGQFKIEMRIDQPLKRALLQFANSPKSKVIPVPPALGDAGFAVAEIPNWYVIRVWHRGPRYVQLRGARSS
jgi:hypothetical protein